MQNEPYDITAKEMAEKLNVTPRRIVALANSRGIGKKIAGSFFFRQSDIDRMKPGPVGNPNFKLTAKPPQK
jgi:hypothetical protein